MIPTLIYGVVLIILNIAKVVVGPYPFFYVYDMPWYASILCLLGILLAVVSIAIGIYYLHNIVHIKNDKIQKKTTK